MLNVHSLIHQLFIEYLLCVSGTIGDNAINKTNILLWLSLYSRLGETTNKINKLTIECQIISAIEKDKSGNGGKSILD